MADDVVVPSPLNNYGQAPGADVVNVNGQYYTQYSDDLTAALLNNDNEIDAMDWLKANNPELYYSLLADRQQNEAFWQQYRDYQKDYYSLQKESLEKAGMNPWLALQNFGSIGTGSVGSSSTGNGSSTLKAQREAKSADMANKLIGAAGGIVGAIVGALIMAML